MPERGELRGELAQALASPPQRGLWITTSERFDQAFQITLQSVIQLDCLFTPSTRTANPLRRLLRDVTDSTAQFRQSLRDSASRYSCSPSHQRNAAIAKNFSLGRSEQSPQPFVESAGNSRKALPDSIKVFHYPHSTTKPQLVILIFLQALSFDFLRLER